MNSIKLLLAGSAMAAGITLAATPAQAQEATCGTYAAGTIVQPAEGTPSGTNSTACGPSASAGGGSSTAIGDNAGASGLNAVAVGAFSSAQASGAVAIGQQATASSAASTALGSAAMALDVNALAVGAGAEALGTQSVAVGTLSVADTNALVLGFDSLAQLTPVNSYHPVVPLLDMIAPETLGNSAQAFGGDSMAIGNFAIVGGLGATLSDPTTVYTGGTAVGAASVVSANNGTTLGARSTATAAGATALGNGASASGANSVAIGAGSVATQANTVSVGSAGSERRITNVAAGVAATDAVNVGQLQSVTGNVTGLQTDVTTLQTDVATNTADISALQSGLADTNSAVDDLDTRVSALEAVAGTFDSRLRQERHRAEAGTATAVALSGAMFLPGKTFNLTGNVGTYHGAVAGAIQLGAMVSQSVALNAGVAKGFNRGGKAAARAGFTFGW